MLLPYTIDFTDKTDTSKPSFQIQPGQINTSNTPLALPGKGRVDYGEFYNENLVKMLENFSSTVPPAPATRGMLWFDRSEGISALKVFDGSGWVQLKTVDVDRVRVPVVSALTSITNPQPGDIAFLSSDQKLYVYVRIGGVAQWMSFASEQWCQSELVIDCGTQAFV